ncbi:hypothetical protein MGG_16182 [Pyricularia oryzae 70-15]|uniref:Uncharacterized protein n=1 Tax=Pyricularia oryzae (strain 70-15 / ATCC MYA-4617 / FGSC 8958) TaxID=242507 RepID=G4MM41_PYRO7|nr:uncharacterized protein MGG_16182 [Pyricularia oryzae 70-15]EHA56926.1 hypothetical protein MGG_16182 [Pyricularia oryzae 70-15]
MFTERNLQAFCQRNLIVLEAAALCGQTGPEEISRSGQKGPFFMVPKTTGLMAVEVEAYCSRFGCDASIVDSKVAEWLIGQGHVQGDLAGIVVAVSAIHKGEPRRRETISKI